jgi:hypothetical protein
MFVTNAVHVGLESVYSCVHVLPLEDKGTENCSQVVSVLNVGLIYIVYKHNTTTVCYIVETLPHGVHSSCCRGETVIRLCACLRRAVTVLLFHSNYMHLRRTTLYHVFS